METDVKEIVVLVHGTWARGGLLPFRQQQPEASWCAEGSLLRSTYTDFFGDETKFVIFNWSGKNSPLERVDSAIALEIEIKRLNKRHPQARVHLVTHSHGGNVAMYSLNSLNVQQCISSLVCFSTPFLYVRVRRYGKRAGAKLQFAMIVMCVAMAVLAASYWVGTSSPGNDTISELNKDLDTLESLRGQLPSFEYFREPSPEIRGSRIDDPKNVFGMYQKAAELEQQRSYEEIRRRISKIEKKWEFLQPGKKPPPDFAYWLDVFVGLIIIGIPGYLIVTGVLTFSRRAHIDAKYLGEQMNLPSSLPFPVFILRRSADEASSALGSTQIIATILDKLVNFCLKLVPEDVPPTREWCFFNVFYGALVVQAILFFAMVGVTIFSDILKGLATWVELLLFSPLGLASTLLFGSQIFLVVAIGLSIGLLILAALPFGLRFVTCVLSLQLSAESTPPGKWPLVQLFQESEMLEENSGTRHSTHSNLEALGHLRHWLETEVRVIR